jgi:hypothetical protein
MTISFDRPSVRRSAVSLAVAAALLILGSATASAAGGPPRPPAAPTTTGRWGYVWADNPTSASYTPDSSYQANSKGHTDTITRSGVGLYQVVFPGLSTSTNGGTVNVTAYGTGDQSYCGVVNWGTTGARGIAVNIRCADTTGALVDSFFDATYSVKSPTARHYGYVWANDSSSASYTPDLFYQFNSAGRTNTITRSGTGLYAVRLPGLAGNNGTVKVTTYGPDSTRCQVEGWGSSGNGRAEIVSVDCFDSAGSPVDAEYTMTFANRVNLLGTTRGYGYAWADQPSAASYTPSGVYSDSKPSGAITITRSNTGLYDVVFSGVGTQVRSDVQITSYGGNSNECRVDSWGSSGSGQDVGVECYDTAGNPIDTLYTIQFIR